MKRTLTAVMVLATLGVMTGCNQASPEDSLKKGNQSLISGDYRTANIEFKSILQKNPESIDARIGLAKINLLNRDFSGAITELEKAKGSLLKKNSSTQDVDILLARAYHNNEFGAGSLELKAQGNPEILYYQVSEYIEQGNIVKAKEIYEKIPKGSGYHQLSSILFQLKEKTLGEILSIFPSINTENSYLDSESSLLQLNVALQANDIDTAIASIKRYHELNPKDNQRRLQYAHMLVNSGNEKEAKQVIASLQKSFPSNGLINEISSRIAYAEKDYESALSFASIASVSAPNAVMPRIIAGFSSAQLNDPKGALENLEFVIDKLPAQHPAQRLYIRLKTSEGDFTGVAEKALEFDTLEEGDAALFSGIGLELMRRGDTEKAKELAQKAVDASKSSGTTAPNLGLLQMSLNQGDLAIRTLEDAFNEDPTSQIASNSLAAGYLASENYEKALELASKWISEERTEGDMLKGVVLSRQGKFSDAITQFEKVINKTPTHFMARAGLIETLVKDAQNKKAKDLLSTWLQEDGMIGLFRNYVASMKSVNGDEGVSLAASQLESWISAGALKGDMIIYLSAQTQYMAKNAELAESKLKTLEKTEVAKQSEYWLLRATLAERKGDVDAALNAYTSWQAIAESDPMPLMGEIRILAELGKYDKAVKRLDETLYRFENKVPGELLKAQLLMKQGKWTTMERQVDSLPREARNSLIGKGLQGVLLAQDDRFEEAEDNLIPLVKETSNEDFLRWLVYSMERQGKHSDVVSLLEDHLSKRAQSPLANFILANESASQGENVLAEARYKISLGNGAGNPLLLNNLAYVQMKLDKFDEALVNSKKAVEMAKDNASYIDTLVNIYLSMDNVELAAKEIESAKTRGVEFNEALKHAENMVNLAK